MASSATDSQSNSGAPGVDSGEVDSGDLRRRFVCHLFGVTREMMGTSLSSSCEPTTDSIQCCEVE
jgi:hypothetical protein